MLSEAEAAEFVAHEPRNAEVIFRYLNGRDVNSSPTQSGSEFVISFGDKSLDEAAQYILPFERVRERVLPVRLRSNRKSHQDRWWIYAESRPALTAALADVEIVTVLSAVSSYAMPIRIPSGSIMSSALVVFPDLELAQFAAITSSIHLAWVLRWGSLMELRIRYSTTDVFDTFPLPTPTADLAHVGTSFDEVRRSIMQRRGFGLTDLYNLVHAKAVQGDPDVDVMRSWQVAMDEATMAAYGWDDVPLDHGFHTYRQLERWTVSPAARVEILDRLLELNHERARAEGQDVPGRDTSDGQEPLFA